MSFLKPHQVAAALGVTTSALRMRRFRGSETIDYIVNNKGRVMYLAESLDKHIDTFYTPPRVGKSNPGVTSSDAFIESVAEPRRNSHKDLTKDLRYMHSIGKINERRIKQKEKSIQKELDEEQKRITFNKAKLQQHKSRSLGSRKVESDYIRWLHKDEIIPNYKPIHETRNTKKDFNYY